MMHTHQMSNIETGNLSRLNPLSLEKLLVICLVVFLIVLPSIVLPELIYPTQTGKSISFFYGIAVLIGLGTVVLSAATISQNVSINSDSGKKAGLYQVSLTAMAQSESGGGVNCTCEDTWFWDQCKADGAGVATCNIGTNCDYGDENC